MMAGDDRLQTDAGTGWVLESKEGSALVQTRGAAQARRGCSAGARWTLSEGRAGRLSGSAMVVLPGDMVALAAGRASAFGLTLLFVLPAGLFMAGFVLGTSLPRGVTQWPSMLTGLAGSMVWRSGHNPARAGSVRCLDCTRPCARKT